MSRIGASEGCCPLLGRLDRTVPSLDDYGRIHFKKSSNAYLDFLDFIAISFSFTR